MKNEGQIDKGLVIHLNASDERGVDIIRMQISQFVKSKTMFHVGMKFVILDEIDYMTKNAQQALKYLIQEYSQNVRFCLICNYISRIEEGLQNEFIRLKFNQLPEELIISFLYNISQKESLGYSLDTIKLIQQLFKSDIRNMINFMQSNHNNAVVNVVSKDVWEKLYSLFLNKTKPDAIKKFIHETSCAFNIDKKNMLKDFMNYLIREKQSLLSLTEPNNFLDFVENLVHNMNCPHNHFVNYAVSYLCEIIPAHGLI